jgi:protoheme IX farnesyltransferase
LEDKNQLIQRLFIFLELTKFRISLFATLSAVTGFILAKQGISREIIIPILGVFFLACGACALNQYQERKIDKLMERTKSRPLPSGKLNPYAGLSISLGLIFSGLFILICGTNSLAFSLGLFAVLWYNGVYTFLKRKTGFAALPGALVGAIPPALGWVCGGGNLFDPRIWVVAFFFFIWQVPHFWLLFLKFAKDYEKAGLRSLTKTFTTEQLKRIIFIWILSAAASSLLIPMFDFLNFHVIHLSLLVATLWLVWNAASFYRSRFIETSLSQAFMKLNIYAFCVISLLSLDKLLI